MPRIDQPGRDRGAAARQPSTIDHRPAWPRDSLGLHHVGVEVDDARDWLARVSATILAVARVQAGWVARAENLDLARALAARVAEDVDQADLLFKRQYGLRAFPVEMARDSRIVPAWVERLEAAPSLLACLVALYRTVKPRLLVEVRHYRAHTAPNADGPTLRQLELIEPELHEQIAWGADVVAAAGQADPSSLAAAAAWASELEQALIAAGGFFGQTIASDGRLWRWRGAPRSDVPALRHLAATVYAAHDLPWDGLLGIARHLGDVGRLAAYLPKMRPPAWPRGQADLAARLSALAELLEATAGRAAGRVPPAAYPTQPAAGHTAGGPVRAGGAFGAAALRGAAAHAREWATRLGPPAAGRRPNVDHRPPAGRARRARPA